MTVKILPGQAKGCVVAPPSKSMAHRYLIAAALSEGVSIVRGIHYSEDILATIDCLEALGVSIQKEHDAVHVTGAKVLAPVADLVCRESGSTLRFMIPLCALSNKPAILKGSDRLMERPLNVYHTLAKQKGLLFEQQKGMVQVCGRLEPGCYELDGGVSSQFVTGLIFALMCQKGNSRIVLTGKIESRSYIDLTIDAVREFGFDVQWSDGNTLLICGTRGRGKEITVEGDYSNAAFFEALSCLGDPVEVSGLKHQTRQGDRIYRDYFAALKRGAPELSLADCPDLGPILFVLAAALNGGTFIDTARLKIKESDRGAAMAAELKKCGVRMELQENRIIVPAGQLKPPAEPINGHNDHRIVMAMAVLLTRLGGCICGAEAVAKSMPDFFEKLSSLEIEVQIDETK